MSNIEQALKAALAAIELIQCFEAKLTNSQTAHGLPSEKVKRKLRDVISDIEKCEPVEKLGRWMIDKSTGTDILTLDNCSVIAGKYANYIMGLLQKEIDKVVSELENTSPQPREWVGLSDEHKTELLKEFFSNDHMFKWLLSATETKLKQLNTKG